MSYLLFLLSWRYLRGAAHTATVSTMVRICFLSIAIGSCALALVVSVMNGFEQVTHQKMRSMHADLTINQPGMQLDAPTILTVLAHEFPQVKAATPSTTEHVIMQTEEEQSIDNVLVMHGIDPATEDTVSNLSKKIISPIKSLAELVENNQIIIGKKLAQTLNIDVGDEVSLAFAQDSQMSRNRVSFTTKKARISGIFSVGINDIDSHVIYASLSFLHQLFPDAGITHIGIALAPGTNETQVAQAITDRVGLNTYSWKELYPALISGLKLEKYAMFLILMLITLVASMNIMALLFMQIIQKRGDIAILSAMGLAHSTLRKVFLLVGTGIALCGSATGLLAAFIIGTLLDRYPFITLPEVYYVTHLPIAMSAEIFLATFAVVVVMSLLASWLPTRQMKAINSADILRFEA